MTERLTEHLTQLLTQEGGSMHRQPNGEPTWDLRFDEFGKLTELTAEAFVEEVRTEGICDLFVFSHGWGTSEEGARRLYDALFPMIADATNAAIGGGAQPGFAGIFWPSLWFPDSPEATGPRAPGSTQETAGAVTDVSAGTAALSGAGIAASLVAGFADPGQRDRLMQLGQLIDEGTLIGGAEPEQRQRERITDIHSLLQSLAPQSASAHAAGAFEDAGEQALLWANDPQQAYQAAAQAFGTIPASSSTQGLGDWFARAINGAKDAVRVLSYTIMKARAGDIGRVGLGPLLADLHRGIPGVRVHLIGHSFGARLVSFALAGVGQPPASPISSLLLVQGAFSHWSFAHAQDNPFGVPGALNAFADRVNGPLVATFTPFDWAVGIWYPKASFLAHQDASAGVAGRWAGLGADGFQAVSPAQTITLLADGALTHDFRRGTYYLVDAAEVINDTQGQPFAGAHSDIVKPQVAQLAVALATPFGQH